MDRQRQNNVVLVIDDDVNHVQVIVDHLERQGLDVAVALDGHAGLRQVELLQPDLILLDVMMPGLDGFETCRRLKANEATRDIPVVFMTALDDVADKIKSFDVGGADYITKPFYAEETLSRVRTHLALRNAHRQLAEQNVQLQQETTAHRLAKETLACQEAELRATLYSIGDAILATDIQGRVVQMNPVAERLTGWTEVEATGKPLDDVFRIVNEDTRRQVESPVSDVLRQGAVVGLSDHTLLISKDGRETPIADSGAPIFDPGGNVTGVVLAFRDQTKERLAWRLVETRLALIEYAAAHTLGELLSQALDKVGAFVDSPIGFYHFVEPDQKTLSLQQWSTRTRQEFCRAEGKGRHYDIEQAGVWVDCVYQKRAVIHNDYEALAHKKGIPEGHAQVIRELVTPVMRDEQVVAILGVGNKPRDYTQEDADIVAYFADVTWEIVQRKRADEALRESEQKYSSLFHNNHSVMLLIDPETGDIVDANSSACEFYGYEKQELTSKRIQKINTLPEEQVCQEMQRAKLAQRKFFNFRHRLASGEVRDVEVFSGPITVQGKRLLYSIIYDVTERRQTEKALQESEARYRNLVEGLPDIVWSFSSKRGTLYASARAEDILGYSPERLYNDPWLWNDSIHPRDRDHIAQAIADFVGGKNLDVEYRVQDAAGNWRWFHDRSIARRMKDDEMIIEGISTDVTARKRAERALERRNRTLNLLNRVGQELAASLNQYTIAEQLLQAVTEVVGCEGSSVWLWEEGQLPPAHSQEDVPQDWLVCRAASPHEQGGSPLNMRVRPGQGIVGWVVERGESAIVQNALDDARFFPGIDQLTGFCTRSLLAVPLQVRGKVIGALKAVNKLSEDTSPEQGGIVLEQGGFDEQDKTLLETLAASAAIAIDNAELVEVLNRRTLELQERNEELDSYAHTVAHDLKGPLGHMVGFAQVLELDHAELPAEEMSGYLRIIAQSGRKMSNIIDELLLMAGLRQAEIELAPLDVASVVDEALKRLDYMIEEYQAQIVLPATWPAALGHSVWVEEVWINYLSNAIKYGGSPPRVELGFDDSGQWTVGSGQSTPITNHQPPPPTIRFWVRDNGAGLTPEEQGRLFKSFERLDQVRVKGHGLGLSIARRIVEKLGGEVGVESPPSWPVESTQDKHNMDEGSMFWFTLLKA